MSSTDPILNAIRIIVDNCLSTAPFDITVKGYIKEVQSGSKYTVTIGGNDYPIHDGAVHAVGDIVEVMIPQNDYDRMFIMPVGGSTYVSNNVLSVNGKTGNVQINLGDINGLTSALANKVDKETDKGLSSNDYTTGDKDKLAGIEEKANNYVHPATHSATMIDETEERQFVSVTDKKELADLTDKKHVHDNQEILNTINQSAVDNWNDKYTKAETDDLVNREISYGHQLIQAVFSIDENTNNTFDTENVTIPDGMAIEIIESSFLVNGIQYDTPEDYTVSVVQDEGQNQHFRFVWNYITDGDGFVLTSNDSIKVNVSYCFKII